MQIKAIINTLELGPFADFADAQTMLDQMARAIDAHYKTTKGEGRDGDGSRIQIVGVDSQGIPRQPIVDWTMNPFLFDATCENARALNLYVGIATGGALDEWFAHEPGTPLPGTPAVDR